MQWRSSRIDEPRNFFLESQLCRARLRAGRDALELGASLPENVQHGGFTSPLLPVCHSIFRTGM
jgi:hypothetical protein